MIKIDIVKIPTGTKSILKTDPKYFFLMQIQI